MNPADRTITVSLIMRDLLAPHPLLEQQIKVKLLISLTQLPLQEHRVVFSVSVKKKKKYVKKEKGHKRRRVSYSSSKIYREEETKRALDRSINEWIIVLKRDM